jgi:WD40 repeat protein
VPSDSGFAWVNQGSSTLATTNGVLTLVGAATGAGAANIVARVKTAPSTPYTITAYVLPCMSHKAFNGYGLCFRQSSDGKLHLFDVVGGDLGLTTLGLRSAKFTNATTFSADYQLARTCEQYRWLRIADNGTNRLCSISSDGINWLQIHSIGRTDFLTADQVGFCVATENAATPNVAPILTIVSWVQA